MNSELQERKPEGHEKDVHYQGVVVGIPTFGKVSETFMISEKTMGAPIFCNIGIVTVRGKPVDIARNELAWNCLRSKVGFLLFRDDDTIAPPDALIKLLERFSHKEKTDPFNNASMIVGGVVYSKNQPPVPMIHREGHTAGFEDWNPGDLVDCDCIGMGCTLIPIGLFDKLLPHITKYRCVNDVCPEPWGEYDKQDTCPICGAGLVPQFFKTIRSIGNSGDIGKDIIATEDSYFCLLGKEKIGMKVYADTGVMTEHEVFHPDPKQTVYYGNYGSVGPGWRIQDRVYYYPDVTHEEDHKNSFSGKIAQNGHKPVKFNLGSGGCNMEGYVNIDLTTECDFKCNAKDIMPAVMQYGAPVEIFSSHLVEHFHRSDVIGVIRNWLKCLKPGGLIDFSVPDGQWALENALEHMNKNGNMDDFPEMIVMGAQRYPGDEHLTLIYRKKIEAIIKACKNQIAKHTIEVIPKGKQINQQCFRVKIWKKGNGVKVAKKAKKKAIVRNTPGRSVGTKRVRVRRAAKGV